MSVALNITGGWKIMMNEATIEKLIEMRLTSMADALRQQMEDNSMEQLSFMERIGLIIDREYTSRKNNHLKRLIKYADFDQSQASIADINYAPARKLNRNQLLDLATCRYIPDAYNIILLGAAGSGKSYLASALGMEACKKFYTVKYIRLPELFIELEAARAEGDFPKVIKQYAKYKLLILDEWLLIKLTEVQARNLPEIIHARHKHASTIFCSQFAPAGWHVKIGESTLADAILDRIVHDSYTIEIHSDGINMRHEYGLKPKF
jgi:DNA replication protein DnaC